MNILITGIDGFVGSHLTDALVTSGNDKIYGMVRNLDELMNVQSFPSFVTLLEAELADRQRVEELIRTVKPHKIFHLAGQAAIPISVRDPVSTFHINIFGTVNILEAARKYTTQTGEPCSVLVVSSGEVYGNVRTEDLPIMESYALNPANPYSVSKASADMIARLYRSSFGLDVVVARPFNHLGPRQSDLFVGSAFARQIAEIRAGMAPPTLKVGNLDPERDFTDVRDVVRAYIKLMEKPQAYDTFNVCSGYTLSIKTLLGYLCEFAGVEIEIEADPERKRKGENPRVVGSAERLWLATGWSPSIPIRQTLKDLLDYWDARVRRQA